MDDYKFRILLSLIRSVALKAQCYEVLGIIENLTREPNATARIEYSIDKPEYEPHNIRMERKDGRVYCHYPGRRHRAGSPRKQQDIK